MLIADDHEMIREGLCHSIGELGRDFETVTASNGAEVLGLLDSGRPLALIILDLFMPDTDGFALVSAACERRPDTPVVVLSGSEDATHMHRVIDAGAAGYIPKRHGRTLMLGALKLVLSGGTYIPPGMLKHAESGSDGRVATNPESNRRRTAQQPALTRRQLDILGLLARGQSNKRIANNLGLSEHTVKAHIRTIFRELGANNRTQAVMKAQQSGYLPAQAEDG